MIKKYAIIVAGGSGTRMNSEEPKQFLLLHGKPLMMHTINQFAFDDTDIIVVLNVDYHDYWIQLCKQYHFSTPHQLVKGGRNRFESVKNGLALVKEKSLVAIHDAVRPLIKPDIIRKAFQQAENKGNAVVAVRSKDSIRRVEGNRSQSVPRDEFYLIQTPQVFNADSLHKAYKVEYRNEFTDDASVVERLGQQIFLLEGDYSNIKITFPEDLILAEALFQQKK